MFRDYDVQRHVRVRRRLFACLFVVGAAWVGAWWISWQAAALGMLANVYLGLAFYFSMWMYPEKE